MLPWLLELGLNVVDLGLAAAAVALVVEGLPSAAGRRSRRRAAEAVANHEDEREESSDGA